MDADKRKKSQPPQPSPEEPEKTTPDPHSYDPRHELEKRADDERRGLEKEFDPDSPDTLKRRLP